LEEAFTHVQSRRGSRRGVKLPSSRENVKATCTLAKNRQPGTSGSQLDPKANQYGNENPHPQQQPNHLQSGKPYFRVAPRLIACASTCRMAAMVVALDFSEIGIPAFGKGAVHGGEGKQEKAPVRF